MNQRNLPGGFAAPMGQSQFQHPLNFNANPNAAWNPLGQMSGMQSPVTSFPLGGLEGGDRSWFQSPTGGGLPTSMGQMPQGGWPWFQRPGARMLGGTGVGGPQPDPYARGWAGMYGQGWTPEMGPPPWLGATWNRQMGQWTQKPFGTPSRSING